MSYLFQRAKFKYYLMFATLTLHLHQNLPHHHHLQEPGPTASLHPHPLYLTHLVCRKFFPWHFDVIKQILVKIWKQRTETPAIKYIHRLCVFLYVVFVYPVFSCTVCLNGCFSFSLASSRYSKINAKLIHSGIFYNNKGYPFKPHNWE